MKEYFDTEIKPLNSELGRKLKVKKIKVISDGRIYTIPVMVQTKRGRMSNSRRNFYVNALGLKI